MRSPWASSAAVFAFALLTAAAAATTAHAEPQLDLGDDPAGAHATDDKPAYVRSRALLALPLLCLVVIAWNVDWRERRARQELAEARAARAPKKAKRP